MSRRTKFTGWQYCSWYGLQRFHSSATLSSQSAPTLTRTEVADLQDQRRQRWTETSALSAMSGDRRGGTGSEDSGKSKGVHLALRLLHHHCPRLPHLATRPLPHPQPSGRLGQPPQHRHLFQPPNLTPVTREHNPKTGWNRSREASVQRPEQQPRTWNRWSLAALHPRSSASAPTTSLPGPLTRTTCEGRDECIP